MRSLILAAAVAAAGTTGALAQSAFDGPYAGLALGYGMGEVTDFAPGGPEPSGAAFGLFAGYNVTNGALLWGGEIDAGFGNLSDDTPCGNAAWTCSGEIGWTGSLRGRLGVLQGGTLFYATAGVALAEATLATSDGVTRFSDSQTLTGWVAGLGAEGQLGSLGSARWRVEYLWHDFGSATFDTDVPYDSGLRYGTLRLGVVFGF